eukprot:397678_1
MITKASTLLYDVALQLISIPTCIILGYKLFKLFSNETANKTVKSIKITIIACISSVCLVAVNEIMYAMTEYLEIKTSLNSSTLNSIHHVGWIIAFITSNTYNILIGLFFMIKVENIYKHTFLAINKTYIRIYFGIYSLSILFWNTIAVMSHGFVYWYPYLSTN